MTEEVPAAPTMPACNGSVPQPDGPLPAIGGIDEIAKSVGTVPYANAETSPDAPPAKEKLKESRNSLAEDMAPGDFAREKGCQEKREEKDGTLQQGPAATQDTGTDGQGSGEGPGGTGGDTAEPGTAAGPGREAAESPAARAGPRGNAAQEQEEDAEEEDTEEDEVQVIEIKKESSEAPRLQQRDSGKEPPAPASPGCNSPLEKPGEQPSLGKKNDISRHSYSRYNTISYRRIRKGNTKQRIDEFESMMHL
ncbi:ERMIN protein, partial [Scytalopus superciliaris]|nr:ERMIN protein [Scytalopus superciliaris]